MGLVGSAIDQLSGNAKRVYEYLLKVREATKEKIIRDTALTSAEKYSVVRSELIREGLVYGKKGRFGGLVLSSSKGQRELAKKYDTKQVKGTLKRKERGKVAELSENARKLWDLIPSDGSFVTNISLRYSLRPRGFSTEAFWKYRKELLDKGLIQIRRGRGGSVARIEYIKEHKVKRKDKLVGDEGKLYEQLRRWLLPNRVEEFSQGGGQAWVVITGKPGKWKRSSGHWSRPDLVLVEVTTYEYLPISRAREVVVTSYEIKRYSPRMDNSWVFEAASHSKGAHYSYLVVETTEERLLDEPPAELSRDLNKFGIGFGWLYIKSETSEYEFKEVLEPGRQNPLPEDENDLLREFQARLTKPQVTAFKNALR